MNSKKGAEILGVHLEGPFINPNDGPRGVHNKKYIISPSIDVYEKLRSWTNHNITILTLDPSTENALNLIKYIVDNSSTVVSIGHHNANREIIRKAINAGAKAATHIGNGLSEYIHRFDNPIWPILAEDKLFGLFITDGFHLPEDMIKVCLRAKGIDKFIVTSDLTYFAGFRPGEYIFEDVSVVLEPNGLLHVKNSSQLAGSTRNISDCMNYLLSLGVINESEAYKIGYTNPLKLINKTINNNHF
jgi:N-acetylglucosamine-6-phosphate deacetylase